MWWSTLLAAALVVVVAFLSYVVVKWALERFVDRATAAASGDWRGVLSARRFFARLSHFAPLLVVNWGLAYLPALPDAVVVRLQRLVAVVIVFAVVRGVAALLGAFGDRYSRSARAAERPITGFLQVIVLVLYLLAGVGALGILLDRDPFALIAGLGAFSAVLLLIFQNTILGFVAGVQLTSTGSVRVGDWISMADMNADGTVTEIALNTVTVKNFDNSSTIIPALNFLSRPFRNWRGLSEEGVRRLSRSLFLDMSSFRFLEEGDVERLSRFVLLRPYLEEKEREIAEWVRKHPEASVDVVNSRRLTNVGTFRAYALRYLRSHPGLAQDRGVLAYQGQPSATGLPLALQAFVNSAEWAVFEGVQADIFDHLLAIVPEFDLRVFQSPSGKDVRSSSGGPVTVAGAVQGPSDGGS